jgi:hypothetical protein
MITAENLEEVVKQISDSDKQKIRKTSKEFCVLYLHVFNVGSYTEIRLTENYTRYKTVGKQGNCILDTEEVIEILDKQDELAENFNELSFE